MPECQLMNGRSVGRSVARFANAVFTKIDKLITGGRPGSTGIKLAALFKVSSLLFYLFPRLLAFPSPVLSRSAVMKPVSAFSGTLLVDHSVHFTLPVHAVMYTTQSKLNPGSPCGQRRGRKN